MVPEVWIWTHYHLTDYICTFNFSPIMRDLGDMDGFRIGGTVVNNLRYADDTVIIAESEEQLRLINVVVTKNEEKGLYLNSAKSFTMVFSKASQVPTCNINVHGKILEQVHLFVYLGSQFTSDARCEKEIRRRIGIAKLLSTHSHDPC